MSMGAYYLKKPVIHCDFCSERIEGRHDETLTELRAQSKEAGWKRKRNRDSVFGFNEVCPHCLDAYNWDQEDEK